MSAHDLYSMFSNFSENTIDSVIEAVGGDTSSAMDILLDGIPAAPLLEAYGQSRLIGLTKDIVVTQDNILADTIGYYKRPGLQMSCPIRVVYQGMPAIDVGGPKRQYFTDALKALKDAVGIFEGPNGRLLSV